MNISSARTQNFAKVRKKLLDGSFKGAKLINKIPTIAHLKKYCGRVDATPVMTSFMADPYSAFAKISIRGFIFISGSMQESRTTCRRALTPAEE